MSKEKTLDLNPLIKILGVLAIIGIVGFSVFKLYELTSFTSVRPDGADALIEPLDNAPPGEVQTVFLRMDATMTRYVLDPPVMKKGVPVKLITDTSILGCMRLWYSPTLGLQGTAASGKNVQYFIPLKEGTYPFSCTMNMGKGRFIVQ